MAEKKSLQIHISALADPLANQLEKQGFRFDKKQIDQFDREIEAIWILRLGHCAMPDNIYDTLLKRIHKKILSHVCEKNKLKAEKTVQK